ncbi:MAG: prolipoprotein diacylglyceryl transferase [Bacteroidota bacterium]
MSLISLLTAYSEASAEALSPLTFHLSSLALYINWNPDGIIIDGLPFRWYSMMFLIGFTIGYFIFKKYLIREKAPLEWLDSLLMYMVIATILGARLGHCIFYDWDYYSQHPLEMILPVKFDPFRFTGFQGLASHGGAIGIVFALWLWTRNHYKGQIFWVLDRMVIPTAMVGGFIRLGNLFNSEIVGQPTEQPWGFIFRQLGEDFARHPVQLYESISYFLIFVLLSWMYWKTDARLKRGRLFGMFFLTIFGARFLLEFVKRSQGGFEDALGGVLTTGQWLSIPLILMGLYFVLRPMKKQPEYVFQQPKQRATTTKSKRKKAKK